ncbi:MFS general substrate transporter [Aspergillus eucalypticola CBS 122712]|uniref:MFS general substrate transporter n=1 Tax=Aspergillus eucalypticola (strain CBS 122712 / IBT 29274) TaxID=1448314 RepID=A0A317W327_ASPEC|nr:MFS general substrate transporter [Aspergillus eucalypticola CBS 122712]PWY81006.1 MFS general substrate transporter [Aspergillus eucalypticola CBS 122712]
MASCLEQRWTSILPALYGAAMTMASLLCGYLVDRTASRRWLLIAGLAGLAVATALLCIGSHLSLWILGRLLQGGAAAAVWTVGMTLLVDRYQGDALGNALGYFAMSTVVGATAGPLLGGVLYEHAGYYAPFGLAFALIALDLALRMMIIETEKDQVTFEHTDMELSQISADERQSNHQDSPPAATAASGGRKGARASGREDHTTSDLEFMDPSSRSSRQTTINKAVFALLRSPRMALALTVYFLLSTTLTAFDSALPLFVRDTFGWKQSAQGLIFIPLMVPHVLDPVIGYIVDRWPKTRCYLITTGLLAMVPLMVSLRFITENSIGHKVLLCTLLALIGGCVELIETPTIVEVTNLALEASTAWPGALGRNTSIALACGLCNCAFAAGSMAGPFLGGFIRDHAGWGTMSWALAVPTGVWGILVLLFLC